MSVTETVRPARWALLVGLVIMVAGCGTHGVIGPGPAVSQSSAASAASAASSQSSAASVAQRAAAADFLPSDPATCAAVLASGTQVALPSAEQLGAVSFPCACQAIKATWSDFGSAYDASSLPEAKAVAAAKAAVAAVVLQAQVDATVQKVNPANLGGSPLGRFQDAVSAVYFGYDRVRAAWTDHDAATASNEYSALQGGETTLGVLCAGPDAVGLQQLQLSQ